MLHCSLLSRCDSIRNDVKAVLWTLAAFVLRSLWYGAVLGLIAGAARYGAGYDPERVSAAQFLGPLLLDSVSRAFLAALFLSFAVSLTRLVLVAKFRPLAGAVLWIAFTALVGGSVLLAPRVREIAPLRSGALAPVVRSGGVTRFPEADIFVADRDGYELRDVVLFSRTPTRSVEFVDEVFVDPFSRTLEIPSADLILSMDEVRTGPSVIFHAPALIGAFAEGFAAGESELRSMTENGRAGGARLWIAVTALCFAVAGAWSFAHMTRWPLLNSTVVLGYSLAVPGFHWVLYDPDVVRVYESVFSAQVQPFAAAATLILVGALLLLTGVVFPSPMKIRREIEDIE